MVFLDVQPRKPLLLIWGSWCAIKPLPFNSRLAPCLSTAFAALLLKGQQGFLRHLCKYFSLSASFLYLVSFAVQWICAGRITDSPVRLVTRCISYAQDISYFSVMPFLLGRNCPFFSSLLGNISHPFFTRTPQRGACSHSSFGCFSVLVCVQLSNSLPSLFLLPAGPFV